MQEKELWEKFHQEGYNRFTLVAKPLKVILKPYRKILNHSTAILDVGCGGGFTTECLRKYYGKSLFTKKVCGIDISSTTIVSAQKKYPKNLFEVCDGQSIPFQDNFFDFIFMHSVTVHIPRRFTINYFKEFYRTLKPAGFALVQMASFPTIDKVEENPVPYPEFGPEPHIGWPIEKTVEVVIKSGLTIESILRRKMKLDNPALATMKDYWVLCSKE